MKIARSMQINVNGTSHTMDVAGHETLLEVLRDRLTLTGAKLSCGRGECGACTVLLSDDTGSARRAVYSCLTLAAACDGARVTTIEGLGNGALHPLQHAFIERDAVQCGFCTPGQLLAATALLDRTLTPTDSDIRAAMSGNLCRCGTYPNIVLAIQDAARVITESAATRSPVANSASNIDAAR
jgi:xanthine dehydrogenase YagT iron-sulfur-binding subunit